MNTLEKRVNNRLRAEIDAERRMQIAATRQHTKLMGAVDAALNDVQAAVEGLRHGSAANLSERVAKLQRLTSAAGEAAREAQLRSARIAVLSQPETFAERVTRAEQNGLAGQIDGPTAAKLVLLHNGKALHVNEITRQLLEAGTVRLDGRTPSQTVSSYLAKNGDTFVRVAPATYDLAERVGS